MKLILVIFLIMDGTCVLYMSQGQGIFSRNYEGLVQFLQDTYQRVSNAAVMSSSEALDMGGCAENEILKALGLYSHSAAMQEEMPF